MEMRACDESALRFRVWITHCENDWRPRAWNDVPPVAVACEPAAEVAYTHTEAAAFVEGFNRAMLAQPRQVWAVAVPVTLRYDGDAQPGMPVYGHAFASDDGAALLSVVSDESLHDHCEGARLPGDAMI